MKIISDLFVGHIIYAKQVPGVVSYNGIVLRVIWILSFVEKLYN